MTARTYSFDPPADEALDERFLANIDEAYVEAFTAKLAERVRFKGTIVRRETASAYAKVAITGLVGIAGMFATIIMLGAMVG